jgi:2-keto-4-pentenoate hydratase/2-oxohepta-3-ene-1,7-dioic acid hydratase in catechol pathway
MLTGRVIYRGAEHHVHTDESGRILSEDGTVVPARDALFLTPTVPSKIVCVGRNYRAHAKELGNPMPERPLLFLKPPSALLNPGGTILLPEDSDRVEYEGEIGVIIGRRCRNLSPSENPMDYVLGVTPLNDVTARDLQKLDVQFTRAKSFDTFCPMGPWCVPVVDVEELFVRTILDGEVVQEGWARDMAFSIPFLISYISRVMTLLPGDVVATGTPSGVGRLSPGCHISVEVCGVRLENSVGI